MDPSPLPPRLTASSHRTDGGRIGPCPACGGQIWWDDRGAKRAGQVKPARPDYRCTTCGEGRSDGDSGWPAWDPPPTTILPTAVAGDVGRCVALRADGQPCRNNAMAGSDRCGPHAQVQKHSSAAKPAATGHRGGAQCQGMTKAGNPCRAGAQRGKRFCPAHDPDAH